MRLLPFLRRRVRLAAFLVFFAALLILVMALDARTTPSLANIGYLFLLSAVLVAAYLGAEWLIAGPYYEALGKAAKGEFSPLGLELPEPPPGEAPEPALLMERLRADAEGDIAMRRLAAREDVEFIAAWVHELKTPVSALRLMAESGELQRAEVLAEIDRLEDRLRKALGYARSSDFAVDSLVEAVDPERAVREVLRRLARSFIAKDLRPELPGPWFELRSDPKWLDFILEQLLSNAAKYSRQGGRVLVSMERDGRETRLIVADEGIGIRAEDLPRLFTRSFTGKNGRGDLAATGLGLYLSRKLCERLGHGLRLESEEGLGTRAILSFPRLSDWNEPARGE